MLNRDNGKHAELVHWGLPLPPWGLALLQPGVRGWVGVAVVDLKTLWSRGGNRQRHTDFQCHVEAQGGPAVYRISSIFSRNIVSRVFLRSLFVSPLPQPRALCLQIELNGFVTVYGNFCSIGFAPMLGVLSKQRQDEL